MLRFPCWRIASTGRSMRLSGGQSPRKRRRGRSGGLGQWIECPRGRSPHGGQARRFGERAGNREGRVKTSRQDRAGKPSARFREGREEKETAAWKPGGFLRPLRSRPLADRQDHRSGSETRDLEHEIHEIHETTTVLQRYLVISFPRSGVGTAFPAAPTARAPGDAERRERTLPRGSVGARIS